MPKPRRRSYLEFLDGRSIRLLKFLGSWQSQAAHSDGATKATQNFPLEMQIELEQFKIESAPKYRALSYTWGPPEESMSPYTAADMVSIMLDGELHYVYPNLFDALLRLRESFSEDCNYFWIDAICINQADLMERQVNVAIMDKIYRNADEVVVWLGKGNPFSEQVFQLVRQVARLEESDFQKFGHELHPSLLTMYGLPDLTSDIWPKFLELYELRWFNRGWIIQEVALAQRAVVCWGRFMMPWPELIAGSKIFLPDRLRKTFFARLMNVEEMDSLPLGRSAHRIGLIQDACFRDDYESLLIVELTTGLRGFGSPAHILVHLMRMSRDFKWMDMRDKVHSLLGLINYTAEIHGLPRLALEPDYSEASTSASVLTATAALVIRSSNCLGMISQVSDESFRQIPGLPSWVPDFVRAPNLSMGRTNAFDTSRFRSLGQLGFQIVDRSLFVKGTQIGTVRATAGLQHIDEFGKIADLLRVSAATTMPPNQDRTEVLWRTMIWDIYGHAREADTHPAPYSLGDSFLAWVVLIMKRHAIDTGLAELAALLNSLGRIDEPLTATRKTLTNRLTTAIVSYLADSDKDDQSAFSTLQQEADAEEFTSHASGVTWAQQLFRTDTGYLGMGPKSGKTGDEVWIISGCPFPMVIRRSDNPVTTYSVMGRAYMHGVMHGEAVTEDSTWSDIRFD